MKGSSARAPGPLIICQRNVNSGRAVTTRHGATFASTGRRPSNGSPGPPDRCRSPLGDGVDALSDPLAAAVRRLVDGTPIWTQSHDQRPLVIRRFPFVSASEPRRRWRPERSEDETTWTAGGQWNLRGRGHLRYATSLTAGLQHAQSRRYARWTVQYRPQRVRADELIGRSCAQTARADRLCRKAVPVVEVRVATN
jgi:hypothetical protein